MSRSGMSRSGECRSGECRAEDASDWGFVDFWRVISVSAVKAGSPDA